MCLPFKLSVSTTNSVSLVVVQLPNSDLKMHPYIDLLEKKMYFLRKCQVLVAL